MKLRRQNVVLFTAAALLCLCWLFWPHSGVYWFGLSLLLLLASRLNFQERLATNHSHARSQHDRLERARLRLLESAVVHAQDGIIILETTPRPEGGRPVLYVNDKFCAMTGYSREEMIGRSLYFLRGKETDSATLAKLRHAMENYEPYKCELLNYRKDGSEFWVDLSLVPVPGLEDPSCSHWVMIQRDISDRKRAEEIQKQTEQLLAEAQSIAHIGSWELDPKTGATKWSKEQKLIFGYDSYQQPLNLPEIILTIHVEDRQRVERVINRALTRGEPFSVTYRLLQPQGEIRIVEEEGRPLFDEKGDVRCFRGVTHDITEKRTVEEQLRQAQKMEIVGQLAGGIAHDFNNLLTAIIGNLEFVSQQLPASVHLETALQAVNRASDLTRKLLSFARKNQLYLTAIPVADLVNEVFMLIERLLGPRIEIVREVQTHAFVQADGTLLTQAILNLCLNARDAMPDGGRLTLTAEELLTDQFSPLPREYVRITVADTGIGMSPEIQERIFEPFFTSKPVGKGSGLGLAMVQGIVLQHEGHIECHSKENLGTRFEIYLPQASADSLLFSKKKSNSEQFPLAVTESAASERESTSAESQILLADDEEMIRAIGRSILAQQGYEVLEARDGAEALELFTEHAETIDLVLLDLTMPKMSGQEVFEAIMTLKPDARVIFSSGYSSDELPRGQDYALLPKPYRPAELLAAVREALATPVESFDVA